MISLNVELRPKTTTFGVCDCDCDFVNCKSIDVIWFGV